MDPFRHIYFSHYLPFPCEQVSVSATTLTKATRTKFMASSPTREDEPLYIGILMTFIQLVKGGWVHNGFASHQTSRKKSWGPLRKTLVKPFIWWSHDPVGGDFYAKFSVSFSQPCINLIQCTIRTTLFASHFGKYAKFHHFCYRAPHPGVVTLFRDQKPRRS